MKKFLFTVLIIFNWLFVAGQFNYRAGNASKFQGTYSALTAPVDTIKVFDTDDTCSDVKTIPFNFVYNGVSYTKFRLSTNGFIRFGTDTIRRPDTNYLFNPLLNIVAPFNTDLIGDSTTVYCMKTTGTAPNRVLTIQFKNVRDYNDIPSRVQYRNINFQIKLYETSYTIEFVYGTFISSGNPSNLIPALVGLKGSDNDRSVNAYKSSSLDYATVNFLDGPYTGNRFNNRNSVLPSPGFTLRFLSVPLTTCDLKVDQIFTMGEIPVGFGFPHAISARIKNVGTQTVSNIPCSLRIYGANIFSDVQNTPTIAPNGTAVVNFALIPSFDNIGMDSVVVTLGRDSFLLNNTLSIDQKVTPGVFSYANNVLPIGRSGFGIDQGVLMTKYFFWNAGIITSVRAYISADSASIGKKVYGCIQSLAGVELGRSPDVILTASDLNKYKEFILSAPVNLNNQYFYAGLAQYRQSNIAYYPLAYQYEGQETRSGAYYSGLLGGGTPIQEVRTAGRFMIQAVINDGIKPFIISQPQALTRCEGARDSIFVRATGQNIQYRWYKNGILLPSFTGPKIIFNPIAVSDAGSYYVKVYNAQDSVVSQTIQVTVNALPRMTSLNKKTICGNNSVALSLTSTVPGATFTWAATANSKVSGESTTAVTSSQISDILVNDTTVPQLVRYTVIPYNNGCAGTSQIDSITVNPVPVVTNAASYSVCSGTTLSILLTSNISTTAFTWVALSNNNVTGESLFTRNTNRITDQLVNNSTADAVVTYRITDTAYGCGGAVKFISVNVSLKPVIQSFTVSNPASCGSATGSITLRGLFPSRAYSVTYSRNGAAVSPSSLLADGSGQLVISGLSAAIYSSIQVSLGSCSSIAIGPISLYDPQGPPVPTISTNSPVCSGNSLQLSASVSLSDPSITYQWAGPDNFSSILRTNTINPASTRASGVYAVTAKLNGCSSPLASVVVQVDSTPVQPLASGPVPGCTGIPLTLSASFSSDQAVTWRWTGPNAFLSSSRNPVISNPVLGDTGSYRVIAVSSVGNCQSAPSFFYLNMEISPVVSGISYADPVACGTATGIIRLQGLSSNSNYFVNYLQNGTLVSDTLISDSLGRVNLNDLTAGIYSGITVRSGNCASLPAGPVSLLEPNAPPSPDVTADSLVCLGGSIRLAAHLNTTDTVLYSWVGPNGFSSSADSLVIPDANFSNDGIYSVFATVNGCTSPAASIPVTVYRLPIPLFSQDTVKACGSTYVLTAQSGYRNYLWNTGDTGLSVTVSASGWYRCSFSQDSCRTTDSVYLSLLDGRVVSNDTSVCKGSSVILSAAATQSIAGNSNPITYSWSNNAASASILVSPLVSTTYSCLVRNGITTCRDSARVTVRLSSTKITSASSCRSYVWNNNTYTQSGNYTYNTVNAAGCDSTAVLQLTIKQATSSLQYRDTCDRYTWNNVIYTQSGIYSYTRTNSVGCDSIAILNLTIRNKTSSVTRVSACDSFFWNNRIYTQSGQDTFRALNAAGCDSFAILIITINRPSSSLTAISNCVSYDWNGSTYTQSGYYTFLTLNSRGCDSTAVLNLTIKNTTQSVKTFSSCVSYSWNNVTYTQSGIYTKAGFRNVAGCDSIAILRLTILSPTISSVSLSVCDSLRWNGSTYTQSGTYTYRRLNAAGCDSTTTLYLTVRRKSSSSASVNTCDSYVWNDSTYTQNGTYTFRTTNQAGCDSIAVLNLTLRRYSSSAVSISNCYSYLWNGTVYTQSGTYTYRTRNATGCDSFAVLNLNIFNATSSNLQASACVTYTWNGSTYIQSGNYTKNFINAAGCDSIAVLSLVIKQPTASSTYITTCESYSWHSNVYTESGTYTYNAVNSAGCDSLVLLYLIIKQATRSLTQMSACNLYQWNGNVYTQSGFYTYRTINRAGCDSSAILNLTIRRSTGSLKTDTACSFYLWNGVGYTQSGSYTYHTFNAAGCDSAAVLRLTVNQNSSSFTSVASCDSFFWNGNMYYFSGTYVYHTPNAAGCDSAAVLRLRINTPTLSRTYQSACLNFTWNGVNYTSTGTYTKSGFTNAVGCDSSAILYLTIDSVSISRQSVSACSAYTWNGVTYTLSGAYTKRSSGLLCDSLAILNLQIKQPSSSSSALSACDSLFWNGSTYTQSGTYTFNTVNRAGCDSTAVLVLTMKRSSSSRVSNTSCVSYAWHSVTYTQSGTYTFDTLNAAGCDSLIILQLTIKNATRLNITRTACLSYAWHSVTFTQSGIYSYTTVNAAGCDSLEVLYLSVLSSDTTQLSVTACDRYNWKNTTYTQSGTYYYTMTNVAGCDSVLKLRLTLKRSTQSVNNAAVCDSIRWNGNTYRQSGTYTFYSFNAAGCDSVAILNLQVSYPTSSQTNLSVCDRYTWHGATYTQSGTYTFDTVGFKGCDSVAVLNLVVKSKSYSLTAAQSCGSYSWQGNNYASSGRYSVVVGPNARGCDSVAILDLTITNSIYLDTTVTACGFFIWRGNTYRQSGNYSFVSSSGTGCDSMLMLRLTVKEAPAAYASAPPILCNGDSTIVLVTAAQGIGPYTGTGAYYQSAGTVNYSVTDAQGCTAVATVTLAEPPALTEYINTTVSGLGGSNGTAIVVVSGGSFPYYYSWSNGSNSNTAQALPAGMVTVVVTDGNGCVVTDSALVLEKLISCTGFVTYPRSSWANSVAGIYGNTHFREYFGAPDYLQAGCGAGSRIRFNEYAALQRFLSSDGATGILPAGTDLLNPDSTQVANSLAGELLALALNAISDSADPRFSPATPLLLDLKVAKGPLVGKTVRFVLDEANRYLGGCQASFGGGDLYDAVRAINLNFEDGRKDLGFLYCRESFPEPDINTVRFNGNVSIYPNPTYGPFVVRFDIKEPSKVQLRLYDAKGALVYDHDAGFLTQGYQSVQVGGSPRLASGIYILKLLIGDAVSTYKVMVGK